LIKQINDHIDIIFSRINQAGLVIYVSHRRCIGSFLGPDTEENEITINYFDGTQASATVIEVQISRLSDLLKDFEEDSPKAKPVRDSYMAVLELMYGENIYDDQQD
jgi:hypothetical protein